MKVSFYATFRQMVGTKTVDLELNGNATVAGLLNEAERRYPNLQKVFWNPDGSLSDYVKVFIDGREIRHLEMLDTPVRDDAIVDIFPPVAGG